MNNVYRIRPAVHTFRDYYLGGSTLSTQRNGQNGTIKYVQNGLYRVPVFMPTASVETKRVPFATEKKARKAKRSSRKTSKRSSRKTSKRTVLKVSFNKSVGLGVLGAKAAQILSGGSLSVIE